MYTAILGCSQDVCSYYGALGYSDIPCTWILPSRDAPGMSVVTMVLQMSTIDVFILGLSVVVNITLTLHKGHGTWHGTTGHVCHLAVEWPNDQKSNHSHTNLFLEEAIFRLDEVLACITLNYLQFILAMLESLHSCSTTLLVTLLSIFRVLRIVFEDNTAEISATCKLM